MSGFLAVVENSFREIIDGWLFWICLVLTVLAASVLFLFQFEEREDTEQIIREAPARILQDTFRQVRNGRLFFVETDPRPDAIKDRLEKTDENTYTLPSMSFWLARDGRDGTRLLSLITPSEIASSARRSGFGEVDFGDIQLTAEYASEVETVTIDRDLLDRYTLDDEQLLEQYPDEVIGKFQSDLLRRVLSGERPAEVDGLTVENRQPEVTLEFSPTFVLTHSERLPGMDRASFAFVDESWPIAEPREEWVLTYVEKNLVDWVAGFFGILIGIIVTAGFIPGLQKPGTLELILSKATPRWVIYLGRFVGGSLFFLLLAAAFTVAGSLFLWISTGIFTGFLLASLIPLSLMFLLIYSASSFLGFLFRSQQLGVLASILGGVMVWGALSLVNSRLIQAALKGFGLGDDVFVVRLMDWLSILPSTGEIKQVPLKFMADQGFFTERTREVVVQPMIQSDLMYSEVLISSVLFISVCLLAAIVVFYRREY